MTILICHQCGEKFECAPVNGEIPIWCENCTPIEAKVIPLRRAANQ